MNKYLPVLICVLLFSSAFAEPKINDQLTVSINQVGLDTISLNLSYTLEKKKNIFSWNGYIYPLLDKELKVFVENVKGEKLSVSSITKFLPKIPLYVEPASEKFYVKELKYKYSPLEIKLSEQIKGCINIYVEYDARKTNIKYLDKVYMKSNQLKLCL